MGDEGRAGLGDPVRKGELEVRGKQLPDVGAADVIGLLNLNNTENLWGHELGPWHSDMLLRTWIDRKRAR